MKVCLSVKPENNRGTGLELSLFSDCEGIRTYYYKTCIFTTYVLRKLPYLYYF